MRAIWLSLILGLLLTPGAYAGRATKAYALTKIQNNECQKNMVVLYNALVKYANRNKGILPAGDNFDGLRELLKYGVTYKNFICDAARVKRAKAKKLNEERNAFAYYGGMDMSKAVKNQGNAPLLSDKPDSRHMNVLLVNGTIVDLKYNKLLRKHKISNYRDIIEGLNKLYKYPPDVLKTLQAKADAMDEKYR